jgi:hypothetical protein
VELYLEVGNALGFRLQVDALGQTPQHFVNFPVVFDGFARNEPAFLVLLGIVLYILEDFVQSIIFTGV